MIDKITSIFSFNEWSIYNILSLVNKATSHNPAQENHQQIMNELMKAMMDF